jgi:hypothetical protein
MWQLLIGGKNTLISAMTEQQHLSFMKEPNILRLTVILFKKDTKRRYFSHTCKVSRSI